ncbi:3'-5' exonuclease [Aestuariibacter sp. A3R04]|uniref:3'-5' exonuclease n=1 Tax=Aestuariibacter sp. A3R04 TaxID=2841571 RepID=UPI001C0952ED|nr:3'-5' exonuclease [Aestuariibacter sp. A3R04]
MLAVLRQCLGLFNRIPADKAERLIHEAPLLAIDLELTSLDSAKAKVTSVGWVEGLGNTINLDSCFYSVVRASGDFAQSPVIHGLIQEHIAGGKHVRDVLKRLKTYADTHIWVFHNANLDLSILQRVFADTGIHCPPVMFIDTLKLAVYQLKKYHQILPPNSATLSVCRQRLGLPAAPAHNALDDAMATLQLWIAQNHALNGSKAIRFGDLLHTRAVDYRKMEKK